MELKKHNRYDYSPIIERPDYDWPDGKRLAVYFALNIEHFSFGEELGRTHRPIPAPSPTFGTMRGGITVYGSVSGVYSTRSNRWDCRCAIS